MPIELEWQDESGAPLARYSGPAITQALFDGVTENSVCVRFIDAYGDTVFNQLQIPVLIKEIAALEPIVQPESLATIRQVSDFLEQARDQIHTYVKFIGD